MPTSSSQPFFPPLQNFSYYEPSFSSNMQYAGPVLPHNFNFNGQIYPPALTTPPFHFNQQHVVPNTVPPANFSYAGPSTNPPQEGIQGNSPAVHDQQLEIDDRSCSISKAQQAIRTPDAAHPYIHVRNWTPIAIEASGACHILGYTVNSGCVVYSKKIQSIHKSGQVVYDGKQYFKLCGPLCWETYQFMYSDLTNVALPEKLASAFASGFPERDWRRAVRQLYCFICRHIDKRRNADLSVSSY